MASRAIALFEIARRFARTPIGWAKALAAKRLHDTQRFFDTAADVGVAYDQIVDIPGRIDDERSSQTNTLALVQHIIGAADRLSVVAEKWIVHTAQFFRPLSMTFQRIDADSEDFCILGAKLVGYLAEPSHFSGADERKIRGIEK